MHQKLLVLLFVFFQFYTANAALTTIQTNEKILHFYYHDSLGYGHPVNAIKGATRVFINAPVLLFEADKNQTPYLIYPGDSLAVTKDMDGYSVFTIKNNIERNNELSFFPLLIKKFGGIYMTFPMHNYQSKAKDMERLKEYENDIKNIETKRLFLLDSFATKLAISTTFKTIVENIIRSTGLKDSMLLYSNNKALLKGNNVYEDKCKQIVASVNETTYSPYMPYLFAALLPVNIAVNNTTEFVIKTEKDFKASFDFVEGNFTKMSKNFLLSRTVYTALNNNVSIPPQYLEKYFIQCTDLNYTNLIKIKLQEIKLTEQLPPDENSLLLSDGTTNSLDNILKDNVGKLIYLDFWASWCSPCRIEMPYSTTLANTFKTKDIVFIYLSIDMNTSDWLKASQEEYLHNNNSYLILNATKAPIIKQFKIQAIPRYILIGKKGEILSEDAPRPSDSKIIELINQYL